MSATKRPPGFTIMEIMVVIIIIGIIAGFGIPNYNKTIRKTHERDAVIQLRGLHAANKIYFASEDQYLLTGTGDLPAINSGLGLSIYANDMTYSYLRDFPDRYHAIAQWTGIGGNFEVCVDETDLGNTNPCCTNAGGTCPTLSVCPGGRTCP